MSSWDIKRAFDRVPKNILTLSWTRLGVPLPVAEYLVGMDTHGTTVIRTPYTERRFKLRGKSTFTTRHPKTPSFKAEVGTGQGDVGSPLNWIAFFDILLCALDREHSDCPLIRSKGRLTKARDTGYADDLVSIMTSLAGLQRKANIVSAFAIIFGLDIAVAKLRACKVQWGQRHTMHVDNESLKVHHFGWDPGEAATIALATQHTKTRGTPTEALKYLGVLFDFSNDDSSSFANLASLLREKLQLLHTKHCDKELKLEAITYSLYPKLRYPAKMAGWRLQDYHYMDKIFSTAFRQILQLPKTFPHDLLYAPRYVGGIGLPLFSTQAHMDKLAMMHRGLLSDESTNAAMEGLLERGIRAAHCLPSTHQHILSPQSSTRPPADATFGHKAAPRSSIWIQSLLEWLQVGGMKLIRHGTTATATPSEPILEYMKRLHLPTPSNGARQLHESALYTTTDLIRLDPSTQMMIWNMDIIRDTYFLRPLLNYSPPQPTLIPLLPGQCWTTDNALFPASDGYIWEYIGQHGAHANIRLWRTDTMAINGAARLISPSQGGGTNVDVSLDELLQGAAYKIVLSGDIKDRIGVDAQFSPLAHS